MTDKSFQANLMRFIAAQNLFSVSLHASREMFGKSYFALGVSERATLDQAVWGFVTANYAALTPELLAPVPQQQEPIGFQNPRPQPTAESEKI